MLALLLAAFVILAILLGAVRIILGWIVPKPAMVRFDRLVGAGVKLYFQIIVVGLAGLIVYALWLGFHHQP